MNQGQNAAPDGTAPWMEEALDRQLSEDRDFPRDTPIQKQYAVLCTHRSGSTLLTESLYQTGVAGDPMEFFNMRLLKKYSGLEDPTQVDINKYLTEMQSRRTSPNGVFGFNIKADQFSMLFKDREKGPGVDLIKNCQHVILHLRGHKIKQAVSAYIGRMKDTFRIPAGADSKTIEEITKDVPFNPAAISMGLHKIFLQERFWVGFLTYHQIPYTLSTYENLVADYANVLAETLGSLGIDPADVDLPEMPTKKIANQKNKDLVEQYDALIRGDGSITEDLF